jgi:DNA-binding beta-propeller fold protein YncE
MISSWITSSKLVLRAALLVLLTGCGMVTGSKAPQPVAASPSSDAAPVALAGLQLGYIWQTGQHNLYPILGVTAATHYGSATLSPDGNVVNAAATVSPSSSWALVLNKDGTLQEWGLLATTTTSTLAAQVPLDSSLMFSPSGTSAAVVSPAAQAALVVSGLPSKPQIARVPMPSGFVTGDIAVSDTGALLVGVMPAGGAGIQFGFLSETHSYSPIGTVQSWGGAAFQPGNTANPVIVADALSAQLTYIANPDATSPTLTSLSVSGILQKAAGVAVSPDGKWAFVADGGKPQLVQVSLQASGPAPAVIPCACTPQQMVPLTPDGIYAISRNVAGKPDWILDARTPQPRTFFVPAIAIPDSNQTASASPKKQPDGTSR